MFLHTTTREKTMFLFTLFVACGDSEQTSTPTEEPKQEMAVPTQTPNAPQAKPATMNPPSDNSCDAHLKSYSELVDEYIVLMKKANAGDASAMQNYPRIMEKAQKSSTELQGLYQDGKIDPDCWKKYNAITNKMAQAGMEMSGASQAEKEEMKQLQKASDKAVDQAACLQKCQGLTDPSQMSTCMTGCM